jgi:predicted oxidoreductase
MRLAGDGSPADRSRGRRAVQAAVDSGYTLFDHADIYGNGECERLFGDCLKAAPALRDEVLVATKCGIRFAGMPQPEDPKRYDFRRDYVEASVDASLERLGVERIDLFMLHRPDFLMDPDEVAAAFDNLHTAGKVAHFGVSNFSPSQVDLLRSTVGFPLLVNQVEINLHNTDALTDGTLDQCRRLGMTPQAWCPLGGVAYPAWGNTLDAEAESRIEAELARQAGLYETEATQVALAWLLRHPAGIMPIIGSTTPERIAAAVAATHIDYRREDWYRLLEARNGQPVP